MQMSVSYNTLSRPSKKTPGGRGEEDSAGPRLLLRRTSPFSCPCLLRCESKLVVLFPKIPNSQTTLSPELSVRKDLKGLGVHWTGVTFSLSPVHVLRRDPCLSVCRSSADVLPEPPPLSPLVERCWGGPPLYLCPFRLFWVCLLLSFGRESRRITGHGKTCLRGGPKLEVRPGTPFFSRVRVPLKDHPK